jgi:hypothetical protein
MHLPRDLIRRPDSIYRLFLMGKTNLYRGLFHSDNVAGALDLEDGSPEYYPIGAGASTQFRS